MLSKGHHWTTGLTGRGQLGQGWRRARAAGRAYSFLFPVAYSQIGKYVHKDPSFGSLDRKYVPTQIHIYVYIYQESALKQMTVWFFCTHRLISGSEFDKVSVEPRSVMCDWLSPSP